MIKYGLIEVLQMFHTHVPYPGICGMGSSVLEFDLRYDLGISPGVKFKQFLNTWNSILEN